MRLSFPHGHGHGHGHGFGHGYFQQFSGLDSYDETGIHRGWLAAVGILFILLGVLGLGAVTLMTIVSVSFFGALALVGGVVQLMQSFTSHGRRNQIAGALLGSLYILAALIIFSNPVASSIVLTIFLGIAMIALGAARIYFSMERRASRYWKWTAVSGGLSILLGFLILAQLPAIGLWIIGLFVSLEMIFHGAAAVGLAMKKGVLT